MNFDKIKGVIGGLAPTLGSALGGPVGGAAATMLAEVLGCDPTPQKLERALQQATPEQIAEIKKAELNFEARMKELDVDIFALEAQDKQHARDAFKEDWTARAIALISVALAWHSSKATYRTAQILYCKCLSTSTASSARA